MQAPGHRWITAIANRTKSANPTGCPKCNKCNVEIVGGRRRPTATINLQAWCEDNGREDLLEEWAHPDKAPQEFLRGSSSVKVPWKCGKCGAGWEANVFSRTRSHQPTGCPKCNPWAGQAAGGPSGGAPGGGAAWKCGKCGGRWQAVVHSRVGPGK